MSRLSREEKRQQWRAAQPAAPVDVRVVDAGNAFVDGVPLAAAPGQEIQQAVLDHLHRRVLETGAPVHASVRDERIGYVVPLQMNPDGSTSFTADPVPTTADPVPTTAVPVATADPVPTSGRVSASDRVPSPGPVPTPSPGPVPTPSPGPVPAPTPGPVAAAASYAAAVPGHAATPEPVRPPYSTPVAAALPKSHPAPTPDVTPHAGSAPAAGALRAMPDVVPGTVQAPTGVFGPPPEMGARPHPVAAPVSSAAPVPAPEWPAAAAPALEEEISVGHPADAQEPPAGPAGARPEAGRDAAAPALGLVPLVTPRVPGPPRQPEPFRPQAPGHVAELMADSEPRPDAGATPARGFDAVAEAVLADGPATVTKEGAELLGEPMARINEAVRSGRIDAAAELAQDTREKALALLGGGHPETLRLTELTAYIAYLAGDPVRSFRLSLDLARQRHRTRDVEGAYGNVQSAAAAWRAVRDPERGLALGHDLIALWAELAVEEGPAAGDLEQLDSARARMTRLTARAARAAER